MNTLEIEALGSSEVFYGFSTDKYPAPRDDVERESMNIVPVDGGYSVTGSVAGGTIDTWSIEGNVYDFVVEPSDANYEIRYNSTVVNPEDFPINNVMPDGSVSPYVVILIVILLYFAYKQRQ